jgi:hypothetical protein
MLYCRAQDIAPPRAHTPSIFKCLNGARHSSEEAKRLKARRRFEEQEAWTVCDYWPHKKKVS